MTIKNIVFDVGNVLVRWDPLFITQNAFPQEQDSVSLSQAIFKHQTWFDLNAGKITQAQAIDQYHQRLGIAKHQLEAMMDIAKHSLVPIEGSFNLLQDMHQAKFNLYALTDNTHEFMRHLRATYDFWKLFKGVVVSAEIGFLKPSQEIYHYLLNTFHLQAKETLFLDDVLVNVEGAKEVGIEAIQFKNAKQCNEILKRMELI